ncbi:hypothetical protein [Streptomyces spectabilis]|uniref:Serine/arginine repetitive matrix protein 2 n=1 Tax=Streptomyces spectabilis TaxID=68270 RepID=A0A516RC98_STRST|nr:hypothetical protein [Streptomyces spectabilis]QDQ13273.1 hypothetical protein FH965_24110 [Streptomyces spectabilis]
MRVFDDDRQEWVGHEQERQAVALHDRDAARQRTAWRGAVTVLAVCGLAFGTWALGWKDEPEPTAYLLAPQSSANSQDVSGDATEPAPTDGASPTVGGLPRGYETLTDVRGFRVALPIGWSRTSTAGQGGIGVVNYRNYGASQRLQVYEVSEPTPEASFRDFLDDTKVPKSPSFQKLSLESITEGQRLTYVTGRIEDEPDAGPWYVVDDRFQAADGKLYALVGYGSGATDRAQVRQLVSNARAWFCPPGSVCQDPG